MNTFNKTFDDRKIAAKQVIEKYSAAVQPEMTHHAINAVDQIKLDAVVPPFELNFQKKKKQLHAQLQGKINKAEDAIANIISNINPPSTQKPAAACSKKASAALMPTDEEIRLDTPRNGHIPRNSERTTLLTTTASQIFLTSGLTKTARFCTIS